MLPISDMDIALQDDLVYSLMLLCSRALVLFVFLMFLQPLLVVARLVQPSHFCCIHDLSSL